MGGGGPPLNAPLASCDWSPNLDDMPGALGNGFPASRGAAGRLPGPPGGMGRPAIMLSNGRAWGGLGRLPLNAPPGSCDWSPKRDASGEGGPLRPGGASLPIMGAGGLAPANGGGGPPGVSCSGGRVRGRLPPKDGEDRKSLGNCPCTWAVGLVSAAASPDPGGTLAEPCIMRASVSRERKPAAWLGSPRSAIERRLFG
jgi:hypothetical protein